MKKLVHNEEVSKAVGMDSRIRSSFLKSSIGFGGSCFKRYFKLVYIAKQYDLNEVAEYWENVVKINSLSNFKNCR